MKVFLVAVLAVVTLTACGKKTDATVLQREAVSIAKYYQPKLDSLDQRVQLIFKRGTTIPATVPGIEEVGKRLGEARDTLIQLKGVISPGPDQKSALEKQAEAAAKDNKVDDLRKLIQDTHVMLDRGTTVIQDNLDAVEGWIAQYDRTAAAGTPAKPEDASKPASQPAAPVQPAPSNTGQNPPRPQP